MVINREIQKEIERIIGEEDLTAHFQPIVMLNKQSIFGYEGLIRGPSNSALHAPESLFNAAQQCGKLVELDILCRKIIIQQFGKLNLPGVLFININPAILAKPDYLAGVTSQCLRENNVRPNRIVIEITETYPIDDFSLMHKAVDHYRNMGFSVALDDLGAGYSGLKLWSEMKPDYVKIDLHFIQGVDTDPTKQQFIQSILQIAKSLGCQTITEGIETKSEYSTLRKLGAELAQGYYFARPDALPTAFADSSLFRRERGASAPGNRLTAQSLLKPCPALTPDSLLGQARQIFDEAAELTSIAVIGEQNTLGLLSRTDVINLTATPEDRQHTSRIPVSEVMKTDVFRAEKNTPIGELSRQVADGAPLECNEFILLDQGRFAGTATLLDLLRQVTAEVTNSPRHISPLTRLPGYVPFQQAVEERLKGRDDFVLAYLEINNLRAFNDRYGYERGDEVLILVAELLRENISPNEDFVSHTGGDDFAIVFRSTDWKIRCRRLLDAFKASIPAHYETSAGSTRSMGESTNPRQFRHLPVITLSIGAVAVSGGSESVSKESLLDRATRARANARKLFGNALHIEDPFAPSMSLPKFQYLH